MTVTAATSPWEPIQLRGTTVPNRLWMSPMCQYSADQTGVPNDWHFTHYASRAVGGAGLIMVESTAVSARHRTTVHDLGIYDDAQTSGHTRLVDIIHAAGAVAAVQLQCAGRKSSHHVPWIQRGQSSPVGPSDGGWIPEAPSAIPFANLTIPVPLNAQALGVVIEDFIHATRNALVAGYDAIEVHGANGYLIHQFLSPLSNSRRDEFGGSLDNRMRFPLKIVDAVRAEWPADKPLLFRIAATDWLDGGITIEESRIFAIELQKRGVDLLDISSGGLSLNAPRSFEPLYNAQLAPELRAAGVPLAASGLVTSGEQVAKMVPDLTDAVFVGRALLKDPYWPLRLRDGEPSKTWPAQYRRAF